MADKKITSYPKEKVNILFLENISDAAVKRFSGAGYTSVKKLTKALSETDLLKEIEDVHLLGIRSKTQITEKVLRAAKKLQAIGCFCIGVNQVDLKNATKNGIAVFNAPYSNTRSVAELVIGASIMLIRRIPDKSKSAHDGIWMKESKGSYELRGKTMGIIGYGNIGTQVSVLAEAMGMRVIFYDIDTKLPLGNAMAKNSIKELVSVSDIVTIHVPDTDQTRMMINKNVLKQFKKGAILLNYARGEVVDLEALSKALKEGLLSGAGVDVYPLEPEKNGDKFETPLQGLSNVLLTPHIGGSTEEAQENIGDDVSNKLFQYLEMGISTGSHTIPELSLPQHPDTHRILHIHYNVPGVLSEINTRLSSHHINILAQYLKTNDFIGYVVLDVDKNLSAQAISLLKEVKNTIKTRLLY
ncbi:MAG TPA: phosphoglycerate dehydrogenase [Puia sp.]|nr:phosphoglycerate dehydrogenase [Puia sp.]